MPEVFLDTSYAIALSVKTDQYHDRAVAVSLELESSGQGMVTTQPILLEIGNALAKNRYRAAAVQLLESLHLDSGIQITPLTQQLYEQGFEFYRLHQDKEWGLIDCISFVVMEQLGLTDALTADEHFEQAGFRALLRHQ
jgi:predicted nucleic acid-binding protein